MRVGMISTRFAGLDGVSLEAAKLAPVIRDAGHDISWLAGELGPEFTPGVLVPDAHFDSAENAELERRAFASDEADPQLETEIWARAARLRTPIAEFLSSVDVAYIHNALSIPMQLPFAVAITEALLETGVPAVGHHHDFGWEKPRFARCTVPAILDGFLPPRMGTMSHAVINSLAKQSLTERTGISATVLPNILDFERGPTRATDGDAYRRAAGIDPDAVVLLQPTRVIERKGIESTIELAAALGSQTVVAFSHAADRDEAYWQRLTEEAAARVVTTVFAPVAPEPSPDAPWLGDAFAAADLVCFPSIQEGYGNALVEALFFKRPLFVNRYDVYVADIAPLGVRAVEIDGRVTPQAVAAAREMLAEPEAAVAAAEHNYAIGLQHMSHRVVRERLLPLLEARTA